MEPSGRRSEVLDIWSQVYASGGIPAVRNVWMQERVGSRVEYGVIPGTIHQSFTQHL